MQGGNREGQWRRHGYGGSGRSRVAHARGVPLSGRGCQRGGRPGASDCGWMALERPGTCGGGLCPLLMERTEESEGEEKQCSCCCRPCGRGRGPCSLGQFGRRQKRERGGGLGRSFGHAGWAGLRAMLGCEASSSLFSFSIFLFLFPFLFYASHMCI